MFGLAHVDTPKGDLDMSGNIAGPTTTVAENSAAYPYGTTEMFPQMEDTSHNLLSNSAHYYMECSNKVRLLCVEVLPWMQILSPFLFQPLPVGYMRSNDWCMYLL